MLIFFQHLNFAQSSNIDSLQKLLKKDKEDTTKVNHLTELAKELMYSNPDTSIFLSTQALHLAEKQKWKKGMANSYFRLAACNYLKGDYTVALECGNKALRLYEELKDNNGKGRAFGVIGLVYWNQGNYANALNYQLKALKIDEEIGDKIGISKDLGNIGIVYVNQGDYPRALDYYFRALKMAEEIRDKNQIALLLSNIGLVYDYQADHFKALEYYFKALKINEELGNKNLIATNLGNIGLAYSNQSNYHKALDYYFKALKMDEQIGDKTGISRHLGNIGELYYTQGDYPKALDYYFKALKITEELGDNYGSGTWHGSIGKAYSKTGKFKDAEIELKKAIALQDSLGSKDLLRQFQETLSQLYDTTGNYKMALVYYKKAMILKDTLFNQEKNKEITRKEMNYEFDKKEAAAKTEQDKKDIEARRVKNVHYFVIVALGILVLSVLVIAFIQWRNNKHKQEANLLLQQEKEKVEITLSELKSTQAQLIQSEKMASLGELTAGIAHEIQNPLNFVNNFSEINKELLAEMNQEIEKGNLSEVKAIAKDVIINQEKINHHGKRADAIVKGMLQHSRSSNGSKEPTNINALADEYLRLAYHGLKAKDQSFNVTMKKDFDDTVGDINIIPQDIGRAVLNLINNAFYAADLTPHGQVKDPDFKQQPTVWVSTKKLGDKVLISIRDNGNGIPQKVLDKIFQPFFTTKPTGQGTGLGLSLAYDIVKAHGGVLKVETREGEGSEFIIQLPVV